MAGQGVYNTEDLLDLAARTAIRAGQEILEIYGKPGIDVRLKADDTPVTQADMRANAIITSALGSSGLPVMSEEGGEIPFDERKEWRLFWLVDPLDGTKEFIDRNGEFTVNIALIKGQTPLAGVVYVPVSDVLYTGVAGRAIRHQGASGISGSFNASHGGPGSKSVRLPCAVEKNYDIVGSRSFMDEKTLAFIGRFRKKYRDSSLVTCGGALKLCMIAEGSAAIYPRLSNISEWDTAAGHAVILAAGGNVVQALHTDRPLVYNKESSTNPWFIAFLDRGWPCAVSGLIPSVPGQS
jgi:3'(2'), 5'-bisphosphate nucleotidase